jgi:replication fork protection complex subunit Csm3/Swi3
MPLTENERRFSGFSIPPLYTYRICSKVALSVWRDEAQGKVVKHIEINSDDDGDDEGSQNREKDKSTEAGDRGIGPPSSPPHSSPPRPTSPLARQNILGSPPHQSQQVVDGRTNDMFRDDDDEFWKNLDMGMDMSLSDVPSAPPTSGPNSVMDEDEDLWNIVDEIEKAPNNTIAVASGPQPENQPPNDDLDDMYV